MVDDDVNEPVEYDAGGVGGEAQDPQPNPVIVEVPVEEIGLQAVQPPAEAPMMSESDEEQDDDEDDDDDDDDDPDDDDDDPDEPGEA